MGVRATLLIRQRVSFRFSAPPTSLLHAFPARVRPLLSVDCFARWRRSHLVSPRSCAQRWKNRCPLSSRCSRIRWHQGKSPPEPKKRVRSARRDRRDPFPHPPPKRACVTQKTPGSRDLPGKGARRAPTASRALSETSLRRRISPTRPLHYPSQKSRRRRRGRTGRWG